jgi:hypothetical protein
MTASLYNSLNFLSANLRENTSPKFRIFLRPLLLLQSQHSSWRRNVFTEPFSRNGSFYGSLTAPFRRHVTIWRLLSFRTWRFYHAHVEQKFIRKVSNCMPHCMGTEPRARDNAFQPPPLFKMVDCSADRVVCTVWFVYVSWTQLFYRLNSEPRGSPG